MAKRGRRQPKPPREPDVVKKWKAYFGDDSFGSLEHWRQLCWDLGLGDSFTSKTQCRKALKTVWVNIPDFLNAVNRPNDVAFFPSQQALAAYTVETRKVFPKRYVGKGSPLAALMAHIF